LLFQSRTERRIISLKGNTTILILAPQAKNKIAKKFPSSFACQDVFDQTEILGNSNPIVSDLEIPY
jgi:hypothetical protein